MADKPSNSRKRVNYQPARNGAAARWRIEERESKKEPARKERSREEAAPKKAPDVAPRKQAARRQTPRKEVARETVGREKPARETSAGAREPRSQKERAQARAAERRKAQTSRPLPEKTAAAKERTRPQREEQKARSGRPERVVAENPQRARHSTSERTRGHVMEAMMPQTSRGGSQSTLFGLPRSTVFIAIILLIVVVFFLWHPWSRGADTVIINDGEAAPPSDILEERFEAMPSYGTIAPVDFNAVEEEGFTSGFVLVPGGIVTDYSIYDTEPELSDESAALLNEALEPFAENDVITAFLLMDIQTGRGFARNIDKKLYGASSFKGPYCGYLLKQYVDGGDTEMTDAFASGYMTESLGYARYGTDSLKSLIEQTIVDSSNDAFASLRVNFSDATLASWLKSVDVDERLAYDTWFPFNTTRNLAKLWMETYYYLQTDSDAAKALREYMGETTKSFMREALTGVRVLDENELVEEAGSAAAVDVDADDGETVDVSTDEAASADELVESTSLRTTGSIGQNLSYAVDHSIDVLTAPEITVIDKAGWNIDSDPNYDALIDCGIVTCNGRDYLLCVMCDAGYTDSNVLMFEKLISAVFEARKDLA